MPYDKDEDLTYCLNYVADTLAYDVPQLAAQGAANWWARTVDLSLVGALNAKAGTTGVDLAGVLNDLAGTSDLDVGGAANALMAIPLTHYTADYSADYARTT